MLHVLSNICEPLLGCSKSFVSHVLLQDQSAFDEEEDDEEDDEDPDEEDMDGQFPPDSITMEVCIVKESSNDALM